MRPETEDGEEDLLERERELERIQDVLAAGASGRGAPLVVVGPSGIGKTSLLHRARDTALAGGFRVLAASGTELERSLPFGVCRQLFEPVLAGADSAERKLLLAGAAQLAGDLLLAPPDAMERRTDWEPGGPGSAGRATPEPRVRSIFALLHGLYWLAANLADQAPLLITIDDVHWGDSPSLRFLDYLGRRLDGLPMVALAAAREDEPDATDPLRPILGSPKVAVLRPGPLGESASAELIAAALGTPPAAEFTAACRKATDGNPFYATELLRALRRAGIEPTSQSARSVSAVGPKVIARQVLDRVTRLPNGSLKFVRALAVLGDGAEIREIASLAGLEVGAASATADALAAAEVLGSHSPPAFSHAILRSAVYEDIPAQERAGSHAEAIKLLAGRGAPTRELAAHLLRTAPAAEPAARELLREAAERSLAEGDPETAVAYLRRALAESPPPAAKFELQLDLGTALARIGEPEGIELMLTAFRFAPDGSARARAAIPLAEALVYIDRAAEAVEILDRALDDLAGADQVAALAAQLEALLRVVGITDLEARRVRLKRAVPGNDRAMDSPDPTAGVPFLALAPLALEIGFAGGPASRVIELARRALAGGRLQREVALTSPLPAVAAYALISASRPDLAERALDTALDRSTRDAIPGGITVAAAARSLARFRRGALRDAQADAETCLRLGDAGRPEVFLPIAVSVLASGHLARGELDAAREVLANPATARLDPDGVLTQPMIECRARLSLAEGDCEAALLDLESCRKWADEWGEASGSWPVQWRAAMALVELRRGNIAVARELAGEDLDLARRFGAPRAIGIALLASGLCESGTSGMERLRKATETLGGCGDRLEHARALVELGAARRRAGQRSEAREPLAAGMASARACGATAVAERAYEELRAIGARPRKILYSGIDALTPSELRVARMAKQGMTNREIAQALFVTRKTVEVHLGHTYQKLDISSRSELPATLGEVSALPNEVEDPGRAGPATDPQ